MARRSTPPPTPQRAELTPDQLQRGITRLRRVVKDVEAFDPQTMQDRRPAELAALEERVREAVEKTFYPGTSQFNRFIDAGDIASRSMVVTFGGDATPLSEHVAKATKNKRDAVALLNEAIRSLEDDLAEIGTPSASSSAAATPQALSRNVFVVHGHDEGARESVARYLEKLGFTAIVLHEQANQGKTIIEKVEAHSGVGFAVVLLTPDDVGGKSAETLKPRARQNVILELGYFVGKLGRDRVCALKRGDVEVPSDFDGVVYVSFEEGSDWRQALAQELEAAGHKIDWNIVMGRKR
jgi:predicted nucleotide-binding protein